MATRRYIMLSLALSTVAFFVASYASKRYLVDAGIASGITRSVLIFSIALMVSYLVEWAVDFIKYDASWVINFGLSGRVDRSDRCRS
jgi:hypothetical protein